MRNIMVAAFATSLLATTASAQDAPAQSGPQNPAVKSMDQNNSSMPVAGANSFTMAQAKSRLMAQGYTQVSNLKKDQDGVWRGTAVKAGQSGPVSVDYQGNIN